MQQWNKRMRLGCTVFSWGCFLVLIAIFGCSSDPNVDTDSSQNISSENLPAHIQNLDSLTVYPADAKPPDTLELVREQVFESNEEVFIKGLVSEVAVDSNDNVYILSQEMGFVRIYVFGPDGAFKKEFIREGRGPKEFEAIISMHIYDNKLYLLGGRLQKIAIFSLEDYSLLADFVIDKSNLKSTDLTKTMIAKDLYVLDDSTFIVSTESKLLSNEHPKKHLYRVDTTGKLQPPKLLDIKRNRIYQTNGRKNSKGFTIMPFALPINRSSIISLSGEGNIYTIWTEDFLIKVYDREGHYLRAIYYPYENAPAQLSDLNLNEEQYPFLSDENAPETWPAIQNMIVDDENRIWVSTIGESDSTFIWFVLNREGELLGTFERPGVKKNINPGAPPMIKVKNGYFYEREVNHITGTDKIIKYKINLESK